MPVGAPPASSASMACRIATRASSYSDENLVREAIEKGAYTYLFKPLNKMDIFSVMVKCLKNTGIMISSK